MSKEPNSSRLRKQRCASNTTSTQLLRCAMVLLLLLLAIPEHNSVVAIHLDIHILLHHDTNETRGNEKVWNNNTAAYGNADDCLYERAIASNRALRNAFPNDEQIDLIGTKPPHLAHITLLLTEFDLEEEGNPTRINITRQDEFLNTIQNIVKPHHDENSNPNYDVFDHHAELLSEPCVSGPYAMWQVQNNHHNTTKTTTPATSPRTISSPSFLQSLSDNLVLNLQPYIKANQTVPDWIYNLPKDSIHRKRKIDYVKRFGSPNVLDEFDPHVTVGYDVVLNHLEERYQILKDLDTGNDSDQGNSGTARGPSNGNNNNNNTIVGGTSPCRGKIEWLNVGVSGDFGGVVLGGKENSWLTLDLRMMDKEKRTATS